MTDEFEQPPDIPQEVWDEMYRIMREAGIPPAFGVSGPDEPLVWGAKRGDLTEDGGIVWTNAGKPLGTVPSVKHYYPDGKAIVDDELLPAFMKWALLFEQRNGDRIIGQSKTLYGERLSTVWLGLDHQYGDGPPLIFETMLFAPDPKKVNRSALSARQRAVMGQRPEPGDAEIIAEADAHEAYTAKHYPHNQLQLRYSTREEAEEMHYKLRLQCLIPPRWRHFLCWTIGQDRTWKHYEDEE
jgi:hypothetical protein